MKKILIFILILCLIFKSNKQIIVPDDSIRFRVIPNSNNLVDLQIKEKVINNVKDKVIKLGKVKDIKESRQNINENIKEINTVVKSTFASNNYIMNYDINYGLNYFPKKKYKDVVYKSGYYESLVIKIGDAKGDNFWCVMFPPLCFLEAKENQRVEYKFLVKEIIDNLLGNK